MTDTTKLRSETFATLHAPRLEALWRDLEGHGCSTVFQSLAFLQSLEDTVVRERDGKPVYVAILDSQEDRALMIVPLTIRTTFGVRRIDFLDHGVADYHFPVVTREVANDPSLAERLRAALLAALPRHDALIFSKLIREFRGVPNPLWTAARLIETREGASRIDLGEKSLERARSQHSVYNKMAKQLAKLKKIPDFEIVEAKTPREIESILNAMANQRKKRFANNGMTDSMQDTAIFAHCRRLALQGCETGKVVLHGLRVGDDWIATSYCLCHKGVITGTLCSLDEGRYKKHSPGLIATILEIEWAQRHKFEIYDFGAGTYDYKDRFGGRHRAIKAITRAETAIGALYLAAWRARLSVRLWLMDRPALGTWLRRRKNRVLSLLGRPAGQERRAPPALSRRSGATGSWSAR
ncbi:GNAT family N-acetyltransferase [Stappia sp.]|uniref:GNAT family N-acetyltransferase n=1 Tax=Stappia sp. TaxID=1870903 RepID=UPI003C7CC547